MAVKNGPNSITVKANSVTSCPAAATETLKSRASAGNRPRIRYSVVTMTKAATAMIRICRPERARVADAAAGAVRVGLDISRL